MLLNHFNSCIWYWIGRYEVRHFKESNNWISQYNLQNESILTQYLNSLYYSVITTVTIGYGDITPTTNAEKIYILIIALISSVAFGYVMSSVSQILQDLNKKQKQFIQKRVQLNKYFASHPVSNELQLKAKKYLEYTFQDDIQSNHQSQESLNYLNNQLKEEIVQEVNLQTLKKINFLNKFFSAQFLEQLSKNLKEHNYGTKCLPSRIQTPDRQSHVPVACTRAHKANF